MRILQKAPTDVGHYQSRQDAIAIGVLLQVPSWLGKIIIGKVIS
jgi:hypothetical protein